jgi:thimet oligopeptidase
MRYSTHPELRHQLYLEYTNRGYPRNVVVLELLIAKRDEKAKLLGYENWADYVTEDKMVGSEANAAAFIERIAGVSREAAGRDYQMLLDAKRQDVPDAMGVADWEKGYYSEKVRAEQYDFDSQAARPYFDYERVRQGIFDVTSRLFGVRYEQVEGLDLWDEDVTAWDLFDGDEQIGRFFLDMHPRDNKYGHAAQFDYRLGVEGERLPVATLVCNFPNPKGSVDGVALMEFGQVSTFFHEFGHLLHTMFAGHRRWAMNSGISTEWDFVEAPSQMLEEWLYDAETLQSFAMHYETGEPIPEALIEKIRAAADFGKGMNTAHQAFYAALSFNCYARDAEGLDTTELVQELQAQYSPFAYVDGSHFQCNFGHLNGYSAIYYTYKWSEVIAKDMFSRFAEDGVLNEETARLYREKVLEPGGSKPAAELVEDFLGREYSFEPFKEWLDGGDADA